MIGFFILLVCWLVPFVWLFWVCVFGDSEPIEEELDGIPESILHQRDLSQEEISEWESLS